jgi:transcriptional regulator with XRE-family HTH domain
VNALRQRYRASAAIRLRTILENEFSRRRLKNPRYSLRAFARSVEVEHSTLSQLLRGRRSMTWKSIRLIACRMRWTGAALLRLSGQPDFQFDSRSISRELGISMDEVNVALTDLCLFGLIQLKGK